MDLTFKFPFNRFDRTYIIILIPAISCIFYREIDKIVGNNDR